MEKPYLPGLELPGGQRAPRAPRQLRRRQSPAASPPAAAEVPGSRGAEPLAPAPGSPVDWPAGVTCVQREGAEGATGRLHLHRAPGCGAVQKTPPAGKVQALTSSENGKVLPPGRGLHPPPHALLEVDLILRFCP